MIDMAKPVTYGEGLLANEIESLRKAVESMERQLQYYREFPGKYYRLLGRFNKLKKTLRQRNRAGLAANTIGSRVAPERGKTRGRKRK